MLKSTLYKFGGVACGVGAAAVAASAFLDERDAFSACRSTSPENPSQVGAPFELVSETGGVVSDTDVFTKPTIVYFGYTFCPDVCPLDNARNAEVQYLLAEQGRDIQTVFITVDPKRDTPEALAAFTDYFHTEMVGLTGTQEQVDAVAASYGAFYEVRDPDDEFYLVDHSTFSYFVLPEMGFVDLIGRSEYADDVAERLDCIINTAEASRA